MKQRRRRKVRRRRKKCETDKEDEEGSDQNSDKDQDNDVSFQEDTQEAIDTIEKKEDWIECRKKNTKEAEDSMKKMKIPCWIEIHRRLKWRLASRIVSLPEERWTRQIFDWHYGFDNKIKTRRQVGRPKRRWEDDINEFIKPGEVKETAKHNFMNSNSWMMKAKKYEGWKKKEEKFVKFGSNFPGSKSETMQREFCFNPSQTGSFSQRPAS